MKSIEWRARRRAPARRSHKRLKNPLVWPMVVAQRLPASARFSRVDVSTLCKDCQMRMNLPVTEQERSFPADQRLISTTDLNSIVTYCNDAFAAISGFTVAELVGQPHNLVRHPDMPAGVFAHMWETIKQGKPWMGVVKNRTKSGDFYWVSAYVTAIYENGRISGYESVRSVPTREQVRRATGHSYWRPPWRWPANTDCRLT
jgi:PAS domain S-box-containing protein